MFVYVRVVGHGRRALIQTVQGPEAPGGEGASGRQNEESQIHAERHGTAGGRRRVLCAGQYTHTVVVSVFFRLRCVLNSLDFPIKTADFSLSGLFCVF